MGDRNPKQKVGYEGRANKGVGQTRRFRRLEPDIPDLLVLAEEDGRMVTDLAKAAPTPPPGMG